MSRASDGLEITTEDGLRTIRLDRPPSNYLDPELMIRLTSALNDADTEPEVGGILLTGGGDIFCAGMGVHLIQASADPTEFGRRLVELLALLPTLGTPIAAAVNGDALASGASLACACDYVAMVPAARLGTTETAVGVWPVIAQVPLIHRIGQRAMENAGSGEPFTAARAMELGAINAVVEPAGLEAHVRTWLQQASRAGSMARAGRRGFYEMMQLPYEQGLQLGLEQFAEMFRSDDEA